MATLIRMRFIANWEEHRKGDRVSVTRAHAGVLEAKGVAVREARGLVRTKPVTGEHSVTKREE